MLFLYFYIGLIMIKWNNKEKFYVFCQMAKTLMFNQRAIKTGIKNNRIVLRRTLYLDSVFVQAQQELEMLKDYYKIPNIPFRQKLSYHELTVQFPNFIKRNYLSFDNISFLFFYEQDMLKIDPSFKLRNF